MKLLDKLKTFFKKPAPVQTEPEEASESIAMTKEALEHFYGFSFDNSVKVSNQTELIPELVDMSKGINERGNVTFGDIATYFKYFENGYILKSDQFRIKKEFSENCLFTIERPVTFFDEKGLIVSMRLSMKEEVTGMRIVLEAPTSFFIEFAEQVPRPVINVK